MAINAKGLGWILPALALMAVAASSVEASEPDLGSDVPAELDLPTGRMQLVHVEGDVAYFVALDSIDRSGAVAEFTSVSVDEPPFVYGGVETAAYAARGLVDCDRGLSRPLATAAFSADGTRVTSDRSAEDWEAVNPQSPLAQQVAFVCDGIKAFPGEVSVGFKATVASGRAAVRRQSGAGD